MTPLDMPPLAMIAEWRKGCSCARSGKPEECHACTLALIGAVERALAAAPVAPAVKVSLSSATCKPDLQVAPVAPADAKRLRDLEIGTYDKSCNRSNEMQYELSENDRHRVYLALLAEKWGSPE